jgi:hypothetical protein
MTMDDDLVEGMHRSLLALHREGYEVDGGTACVECGSIYPCATVRIISSFQEASIVRVANAGATAGRGGTQYPKTHDFKYPECPEFSGGYCERHHGRPTTSAS